ncbi:MAG: hypothetical protein LUI06_03615 [Ruminococcus sp.]|nr:hypothetical protein [Ruminococcus sp.]
MSIVGKLKRKSKDRKLGKRIVSCLAAVALAMTTFVSTFPTITADAATTGDIKLSAENVIAQACSVLGKSYKLNSKGYSNGSFLSASKVTSLDCSGLVYWTLGTLGVSTSGYATNNPVPRDTYDWLYTKVTSSGYSGKITSSTTFKWTYGGVTQTITADKANQDTSTANYKNGDNGWLRYWQISETEDITPGSIVVCENQYGGYNHMWIYLGEFSSKSDVITYISSITGMSSSEISPYVSDKGTAGTHWRIEATSSTFGDVSSCVMIDNGETGKKGSSYLATVYTTPSDDDGQIVLKKAFDDNGSIDKDGYISIKFTVEETNTDEKHSKVLAYKKINFFQNILLTIENTHKMWYNKI